MKSDRPISEVLSDIAGNLQTLVRSEFQQAKTEVRHELGKSASAGFLLGAGLVMVVLSGVFLLLAAVYALSMVMPAWAAALIVAAGEGLMGALFVAFGIKKFKSVRAAPRTVASMKENVEWAKQLTR